MCHNYELSELIRICDKLISRIGSMQQLALNAHHPFDRAPL